MADQRVVGLMAFVFELDKWRVGGFGELQGFLVILKALDEDGNAAVVEQAEGVGAVCRGSSCLASRA